MSSREREREVKRLGFELVRMGIYPAAAWAYVLGRIDGARELDREIAVLAAAIVLREAIDRRRPRLSQLLRRHAIEVEDRSDERRTPREGQWN